MDNISPVNVAISAEDEEFSEAAGSRKKKKEARKQAKAKRKAERKKKRADKKQTRADRKADRKKRREERRRLRKEGKELTPEQEADELLDMEEAAEDGDLSESEELKEEIRTSGEYDDDEIKGKKMPTWAWVAIGGLGLLGIAGIIIAVAAPKTQKATA